MDAAMLWPWLVRFGVAKLYDIHAINHGYGGYRLVRRDRYVYPDISTHRQSLRTLCIEITRQLLKYPPHGMTAQQTGVALKAIQEYVNTFADVKSIRGRAAR